MFVALVIYTSTNGFQNKIHVPHRELEFTLESGEKIPVLRQTAFPTLEAAQTALDVETNPETGFTDSIIENGYRAVILDLTTGTVVRDTVVAGTQEAAAVQQA